MCPPVRRRPGLRHQPADDVRRHLLRHLPGQHPLPRVVLHHVSERKHLSCLALLLPFCQRLMPLRVALQLPLPRPAGPDSVSPQQHVSSAALLPCRCASMECATASRFLPAAAPSCCCCLYCFSSARFVRRQSVVMNMAVRSQLRRWPRVHHHQRRQHGRRPPERRHVPRARHHRCGRRLRRPPRLRLVRQDRCLRPAV